MKTGWLVLSALVSAGALPMAAADDMAVNDNPLAMRVKQLHRYRLSAAIRPLLFWVGARNVGDAHIVWRDQEEGRRGYELLLGSDPARTPRHINRWGFVREDAGPTGAIMLGVMNRSEDDNLTSAQAKMAQEAKEGKFLFKMIRASLNGDEARAENLVVYAPTDFTFRELESLQRYVDSTRPPPRIRTGRLPPGTHPGLLFATADLVNASVEAAQGPGNAGPAVRKVQYTFNTAPYDLTLKSWERVDKVERGGRTLRKLVRLQFESRNLEKGSVERFTLLCGTEGALLGVPVFIQYQPRWWFKIEGWLDEEEIPGPALRGSAPADLDAQLLHPAVEGRRIETESARRSLRPLDAAARALERPLDQLTLGVDQARRRRVEVGDPGKLVDPQGVAHGQDGRVLDHVP